MDLSCSNINLHPQANTFLFQHYRTFLNIFNDVLGLLEIDYIAIALLNSQDKLLFLSSQPSIECNLIEHNLWQCDASFQKDFFMQDQAQLWEELYHHTKHKLLLNYKQQAPKFSMGISVSSSFEEYRVVFSFALKSTNEIIIKNAMNKIDALLRMGLFCLHNITKKIVLPERQGVVTKTPSLKLIINNKVPNENNT